MPTTPTTFTVEGGGPFPIDMLRYDQCWPRSEGEDSRAIEQSFPQGRRVTGARYRVTLVTHASNRPTGARWESFGFKVVQ